MTRPHALHAVATIAAFAAASCTTPTPDEVVASRGAVQRALAEMPYVAGVAYADDGVPYMLHGRLGVAAAPIRDTDDAASALSSALRPIAAAFLVNADDLIPTRVQHDELGMSHVRYAQRNNGLPVIGGDLVVHIDADRVITSVNGSVRDGAALSADPRITADTASEIARGATIESNVDVTASELLYVIASRDSAMHLAWEVEVIGRDGLLLHDRVYVDAASGAVVDRHPQVFTARNREIHDGNGCSYGIFGCPGAEQVGTENSPPTGDAVALAAFTNTGITYDCYSTLFGRDSYNGNGAKLKSIVHVVFQGPQGTTGNNAAWTGNQMVYGDGDGQMMAPLAQSLDVTAHELTHGVTSSTANLTYQNEPGALNEGISDIMAAVCEAWKDGAVSADTWLVGEDIFTPNMAGDALRYMANPTADASLYPAELGGSRDFYAERYQGTQDNGGVHLNSGIPNLAFQLLVAGGKHPRNKTTFNVPGIGITKAGAIFQRALTQGYFTSNTNMAQARTQTEMVASQLYPGATVTAVGLAWAAVGVGSPPAVSDTTPPVVTIVSPVDGATVNAGFTVTVQASDDVAVERVEVSIDGTVVGTDTTAPYEVAAPATLATGSHTITATAFDAFNQASDTATVTIASESGCQSDDDCQGDEQCKGGTCVAPTGCSTDAECYNGQTCTGGVCVADGGNQTGEGGGCGCATSADGGIAFGNLVLLLGALLIGQRRRR